MISTCSKHVVDVDVEHLTLTPVCGKSTGLQVLFTQSGSALVESFALGCGLAGLGP